MSRTTPEMPPAGGRRRAVPADPVCARCAREGESCCRLGSQAEAACFPLSGPEIRRLEACLPPDFSRGLVRQEANSPLFLQSLHRLFPHEPQRVEELFPAGRTHPGLALDSAGACPLLGPQGCLLPDQGRPWYCRLFPFWVIGRGLRCFARQDCLAVRENPGPAALMRAFRISRGEILELYASLRRDWGFES